MWLDLVLLRVEGLLVLVSGHGLPHVISIFVTVVVLDYPKHYVIESFVEADCDLVARADKEVDEVAVVGLCGHLFKVVH